MHEVTQLLSALERGNAQAGEQLLPIVYEELRRLASHKLAAEAPGQTLQPTALVHEAWMRLGDGSEFKWQNQRHFFAAAAEAMRRILIDRARRRRVRVTAGLVVEGDLDESQIPAGPENEELLGIHEVLDQLADIDEQAAMLVKFRYFMGMSMPEAAEALGIPLRSAERLWTFARARLRQALAER